MALKSANQPIRWLQRIGTWIKEAVFFILEVLKSFLNFKEVDGLLVKGRKVADLIVRRVLYFTVDYGLVFLSVAIVIAMKAFGFSFLWVFLALWVFDFAAAGFFVVIYEVTGKDLSLGEDLRRATDTIHRKSRIAGWLTVLFVIGQAVYWTGPEQIVIFFRKEIRTTSRVVATLFILTAIQAFIWTVLYWLGYDLVAKLF